MNDKIYALVLVVLAILAVFLTPGAIVPALEIMTLKLVYVAFLLAVVYGLLHFTRGTQFDVQREIFDKNNLAGAVFVGAIVLSLATVIGK